MKEINYVIWKENKYYVARCLNVEVSSFGERSNENNDEEKQNVLFHLIHLIMFCYYW